VVQTLNQFALLNPAISSEMIDGGLFQEQIEAKNIQGVPAVYLNGEAFANGKIDTARLVEKLLERYPDLASAAAPASTAAAAASFHVSSACDQPERIFTVTGTADPVCTAASLTALTTA